MERIQTHRKERKPATHKRRATCLRYRWGTTLEANFPWSFIPKTEELGEGKGEENEVFIGSRLGDIPFTALRAFPIWEDGLRSLHLTLVVDCLHFAAWYSRSHSFILY